MSAGEEALNPGVDLTSNTVMAGLAEEEAVGHFIKCFGQVHHNLASVLASLQTAGNFADQPNQLALAGQPLLPEAVLLRADTLLGLLY